MAKSNKDEILTIRVTKEIKKLLQVLAEKDQRSLSDYIRIQLEKLAKSDK